MRILVTGSDGFIGMNLREALRERGGFGLLPVTRATSGPELQAAVAEAEAVIHLAGANRPEDPAEFTRGNVGFTALLCDALAALGRPVPVAFASSIQAGRDTPYGQTKRAAEERLALHAKRTGSPVAIYRLPNVFGKWCRPNYNSAVATFCHNIARGLPIQVNDPAAEVQLVYVDTVVQELIEFLKVPSEGLRFPGIAPVYRMSVGELAAQIRAFRDVRQSLVTEPVGTGLVRALYSTYVSELPAADFSYSIPVHSDPRGTFVEMLKTRDSGQFSYFTAHPGVTRGSHYHHSKTEKFLVISGRARFRFRHLLTNELYELETRGGAPTIVETIPGWVHDITNIGEDELFVMLWANEIFDPGRPDTFAARLEP